MHILAMDVSPHLRYSQYSILPQRHCIQTIPKNSQYLTIRFVFITLALSFLPQTNQYCLNLHQVSLASSRSILSSAKAALMAFVYCKSAFQHSLPLYILLSFENFLSYIILSYSKYIAYYPVWTCTCRTLNVMSNDIIGMIWSSFKVRCFLFSLLFLIRLFIGSIFV